MGGNTNDFIDFLIIIRNWLDKNPTLAFDLEGRFLVTQENRTSDNRLLTLSKTIIEKPLRNTLRKNINSKQYKNNRYEEIKKRMEDKYGINLSDIEAKNQQKESEMVELTVKIKIDSEDVNEAEKWLEELAENEYFDFEIVNSTKVE